MTGPERRWRILQVGSSLRLHTHKLEKLAWEKGCVVTSVVHVVTDQNLGPTHPNIALSRGLPPFSYLEEVFVDTTKHLWSRDSRVYTCQAQHIKGPGAYLRCGYYYRQ